MRAIEPRSRASEAHEPADILVNGKIVAHGEIVTVDNHYGVRITRVDP